jgi:cyclohexa-1,5-dienecarbonyl-CoA hydratase
MSELVSIDRDDDGAIWRLTFGRPPGNILDHATLHELAAAFNEMRKESALKAVCLAGNGDHFSYGASIDEHQPEQVEALLAAVTQAVLAIVDSHLVIVSAVKGRCLGGGLEIAALAHRVMCTRDATFAQPEIALGVFAPVGSIVLAPRIGQAAADDLCLTGRTVDATAAKAMGLVDEVVDGDVMAAAVEWARVHCAPRSARSLRYAVQATRAHFTARVHAELPELNHLYLDSLMRTRDASEGIQAFLEKRPPVWVNE